jgi:hypothetical protein
MSYFLSSFSVLKQSIDNVNEKTPNIAKQIESRIKKLVSA